MRILVAHQDARTRRRLVRAARGFQASDAEVTASPEETWERVRDWQPDVVLMSGPIAEHYGVEVSRSALSSPAEGRTVAEIDAKATPPLGRRRPRRDRERAALELARILLAIEDGLVGPSRRANQLRSDRVPERSSSIEQLSGMERVILGAVAAGSTTTELADKYGVTEDVIDGHIVEVMAKLHRLDDGP